MATPLLVPAILSLEAAAILLLIMLARDVFSSWSFQRHWDYRTLAQPLGVVLEYVRSRQAMSHRIVL